MSEYSNVFIGDIKKQGSIEVELSRNNLPYQFLSKIFFQQKHFKQYTEEWDDNEPHDFYCYVRPISEILTCLELMGSTLDKIKSMYKQELNLYQKELNAYQQESHNDGLESGFWFSHYEEFISDKKSNIQLEADSFFNELKSISIKEFCKFDSYKYSKKSFNFEDMKDRYSGFGLFFHKMMLEKYEKNLGEFHLYFLSRLNPFDFTRLISINDYILKQYLVLNYTDLVHGGYSNEFLEDNDIRSIGRLEKFLIITEGSSDTEIIKRSMNTLKPHVLL